VEDDVKPLRYGIVGSGAVGGLYGGLLANHGEEVHFLLHSDLEHVRSHGLRVDSVWGDFHLESPAIYKDVSEMPVCDVVIVALKSTRNDLLDQWLPNLVADHGVVLTLQNGLNVEADVRRTVAPGHVLGGCCFLCSNKVGPGHIHHLDYGRVAFGVYEDEHDRRTEAGEPTALASDSDRQEGNVKSSDSEAEASPAEAIGKRVLADMKAAGIEAHWTDDLAATRWRKLMWNIPFNGLSVALDASTDEIIASTAGRKLANQLIGEVHAGAAVCGITIDPAAIRATMEHTETMVPYDSSMRLDFRHGRPMEVEAIFGNPLSAVLKAEGKKGGSSVVDSTESQCKSMQCKTMPSVEFLYHQLTFLNERLAGIASS